LWGVRGGGLAIVRLEQWRIFSTFFLHSIATVFGPLSDRQK
jgi:hypothetical protein